MTFRAGPVSPALIPESLCMKLSLLALILCLFPFVAMTSPLDSAEQAMQSGQTEKALALVHAYQPTDRAGSIRKLWVLGVAYNRLNRPRAAIAPLDRLVALAPAKADFRLELALALLRAGQSDRARYHFTLASGAGLQPALQARVQAEIDKIDTSKDWQGYLRFALVPESNAARRTAAETVSLGGLTFRLQPGAQAQSAVGAELGFGLAALPKLSDNLRARLAFDVQGRTFDGRAPEDVTLRIGAGLLHFGDRGRQFSADVFAAHRWLDTSVYSRSHGIDLRHSRLVGAKTNVTTLFVHERLSYVQPSYDVNRTAISFQVSHIATPQIQLLAAARAERRHSANQLAAGQAFGLSLGGQYSFSGGLRAGLMLSYEHDSFVGVHPLFGVRRVDHKSAAMVQINNQNWSHRGFSPVLKIGVERRRSSIVINSYQNLTASIGLTRSF
ncbi:surface lipoprotein assembly modifier [Pseudotabrizicola sp. 4114]|uniref:surface lipoprotein assembly modifier n=1 Tax=Pseudotabrizicola sp. 4114 TaxID=2817731 RepID=UPI002865F573|nr:hypothetical protein [Pseudorhodobacter sp. 4114]